MDSDKDTKILEAMVIQNLEDAYSEVQRQLSTLPEPDPLSKKSDWIRRAMLKAAMDYLLFGHFPRHRFEVAEICATGIALGWKPILYLRSFELFKNPLSLPVIFKDTEYRMYNALRRMGYPQLAISPVEHVHDGLYREFANSDHPFRDDVEGGFERIMCPYRMLTCANAYWQDGFRMLSECAHLTVIMLTHPTPSVQVELESLKRRNLLKRLIVIIPFEDEHDINPFIDEHDKYNRKQIIGIFFSIMKDPPEEFTFSRLFAIYYDNEGRRQFYTLPEGESIDLSQKDYVADAIQSFGIKPPDCNWFGIPNHWFTIPYSWSSSQQGIENKSVSSARPQQMTDVLNSILQVLSKRRSFSFTEVEKRVNLCRKALTLVNRDRQPELWAALQGHLGNYLKMNPPGPQGDQADNLEKAIGHYQQALKFYTRKGFPEEWAGTLSNLADAYAKRIYGKRTKNLKQAIKHYKQALRVYTHKAFPEHRDMTIKKVTELSDLIKSGSR